MAQWLRALALAFISKDLGLFSSTYVAAYNHLQSKIQCPLAREATRYTRHTRHTHRQVTYIHILNTHTDTYTPQQNPNGCG